MRIAAGGVEAESAVVPRRRKRVLAALAVWLALAGAAWLWAGDHPEGAAGAITDLLSVAETPRGAFGVLVVAFAIRPLTLLPPTVLTAFAGFLLGPWLGFVVATLAVVSTSLVPYGAARLLRGRSLRPPRAGWRSALTRRPFAAVLVARLTMLPGDLVNVSAGVLRVPLWPFVAGTVLGGSPGMLVGVLAGASLRGSRFSVDALVLDLRLLVAALAVLLVSLAVAALLRRREVLA
jgi:uncharacterized membrane protein YdjX (TVP38/TMEM64 family)